MTLRSISVAFAAAAAAVVLGMAVAAVRPAPASAQDTAPGGKRPRSGEDGPAADLSLVLGRPTDRSIAISVRSAAALEGWVEYGAAPGKYTAKTPSRAFAAGVPAEIEIAGLEPDSKYYYRLRSKRAGDAAAAESAVHSFRTQRKPGTAFTFAVQGDSHPERDGKMYDPRLYAQTLESVAAEAPDFYVTLGDDFSIERLIETQTVTQENVDRVYAHQRGFLGIVGSSSPLFLVNGNHEQAARYLLDGTPGSPAACAGRARTSHFALPAPGGFYTGDAEEVPHVGLLRDYYAWTWGDALFAVIDPYWHSPVPVDNEAGADGKGGGKGGGGKGKGGRDLWETGLGDAQYRWLLKTLTESTARYKFVFAHHVLGTGRGGVEQAGLFEWGGKGKRGDDEFAARRPGWEMPLHQLFVKTGVTVFFQGHDHIFARQELDGVVYQSTPNPADATYTAFNRQAYRSGDVLPNCGHLRVTVRPEDVLVEYVRTVLPGDEAKAGAKDGDVSFKYTVKPRARAEAAK